jgi:transglutaminase-like putative cysteine protease
MAKTWRSVVTALLLAAGALALFVGRWSLVGSGLHGTHGGAPWRVTLVAVGELSATDASVTTPVPPDFRRQHIFDERFHSGELLKPAARGAEPDRREAVWRRAVPSGSAPFRLTYSFRCLTGVRQATAGMQERSRRIDAAPAEGAALRPSPHVESEHREISQKAQELTESDAAPLDQVRALFEYVARLETEPSFGVQGALQCLRGGGGDAGGKSRLLVALCRSRGVPARLVHGLILTGSQEQGLHRWAEAWVNDHWLPMCPTHHHFGGDNFPRNYLVLSFGDEECVRGHGVAQAQVQHRFLVQGLHDLTDDGASAGPAAAALRRLSLHTLRPAEQHLVRFLLLLPLSTLIVSIFRVVIGVPTFGTFTPALLGLAFLDWKALPAGLGILFLTVMIGWGLRHALDGYHLLLVPRLGILLTLIVAFLIVLVAAAGRFGIPVTQYVSLFPLVILTHMVERFGTLESEDGTPASFKALLCTFLVAATVSVALAPDAVTFTLFSYPELLGLALAGQFLLGRYTGYRLTELYRFRDLAEGGPPPEVRS